MGLLKIVQQIILMLQLSIGFCRSENFLPDDCIYMYNTSKIVCEGVIPYEVPHNVGEVVLLRMLEKQLSKNIFCNVTWTNVTRLSIISIVSDIDPKIADGTFDCLSQIQILKLNVSHLVEFTNLTFSGLSDVFELDLSGCTRITTSDIVTALSSGAVLPKLSILTLVETGRVRSGIEFTQEFIGALAERHVSHLNASRTHVSVTGTNFHHLCETLVVLDLSDSLIMHTRSFNKSLDCNSLQMIDISGVQFALGQYVRQRIEFTNILQQITSKLIPVFFLGTSVIYASRLLPGDFQIFAVNSSVTFIGTFRWTEIHVTGYNIPSCDIELNFSYNQLKFVDLSANGIQTIGKHIFRNLTFLTKIDLSNNKLSRSKSFNDVFSYLFRSNSHLREISLRNNGLTSLPPKTFLSNSALKMLYLSGNNMKQIVFDVSILASLTYLSLQNNSIETLDGVSRNTLDQLYNIQHKKSKDTQNNITAVVNLLENHFSCKCSSLAFINWFVKSPIFYTTKSLYHCVLDGKELPMNDAAVYVTSDDCERSKRTIRAIVLGTLIPTLCIAAIVATIIISLKRRRMKFIYKQYEHKVRRLHDDALRCQFPVFLSFSSDDHHFVIPNVFHPLEVCTSISILVVL